MPSMIFIYTGRFSDNPKSGSAVRPIQMLKAFREIGFEVEEVVGYSAERKLAISAIKKSIRRGVKYDFCYVETTTMPIALGDPGHLPLRPFMDLRFLRFLKRNGIPVFLFYRDVYWNFPAYGRKLGFIKRNGARFFYRLELKHLYGILSKLYLPSRRMAQYLPRCPQDRTGELPPGCIHFDFRRRTSGKILNLLYVGGVTPPHYDTSDMIECVRGVGAFQLVVVCRKEELPAIARHIEDLENVTVEHVSSNELASIYSNTDIVMIFNRPTEYLSFAMPVKLFESVGYGVPVLARTGTAVGDFVEKENLGWVVPGPEEARRTLRRLAENPDELLEVRLSVKQAATRHTWVERARKVSRDAEEVMRATSTLRK